MMHRIDTLNGHHLINLTTFRQDGTPVATPVTFAPAGNKLYVVTGAQTGKIKRLKHTTRVQIAPCDRHGTNLGATIDGQAHILPDRVAQALRPQLKFKAPTFVMFLFNRLRELRSGGNVYVEISLR
jgi:hypothetical protein